MKVKFIKKIVATLCAVTMATAAVAPSVGAVRVSDEVDLRMKNCVSHDYNLEAISRFVPSLNETLETGKRFCEVHKNKPGLKVVVEKARKLVEILDNWEIVRVDRDFSSLEVCDSPFSFVEGRWQELQTNSNLVNELCKNIDSLRYGLLIRIPKDFVKPTGNGHIVDNFDRLFSDINIGNNRQWMVNYFLEDARSNIYQRKGKEELEKKYNQVRSLYWTEREKFIKWRSDNRYNLYQDGFGDDTTTNKRQEIERNMVPLLGNKLETDQMRNLIRLAQGCIDDMKQFRTAYNEYRSHRVFDLVSSLNKDIQKIEQEKRECVEDFDSEIRNVKREILSLEFLINNSVEFGVDNMQINSLLDEAEQKQRELSDLQKQKSDKVAEYDKKIKVNSDKLQSLNRELNELMG